MKHELKAIALLFVVLLVWGCFDPTTTTKGTPTPFVTPVEASATATPPLPTATVVPATPEPSPTATPTPPPPPPPLPAKAVDVSNWWSNPISDQKASDYAEGFVVNGYGHMIAGTQFPNITWQQLIAGQKNGMTTDIYVQLCTSCDYREQIWEATQFPTWWMPIGATWVAFETPPPPGVSAEQWVREAMNAAVAAGLPNPGIYTAAWWWNAWIHDSSEFAQYPLWYANYTNTPTIDWARERFGAWSAPTWKQYAGSTIKLDLLEPLIIASLGFVPAGIIPRVPQVPVVGANVDLNVRYRNP